MKGGARKKSGEGAGERWQGADPESISMLNGDYEDSEQLGYEDQEQERARDEEFEENDREEEYEEEEEEEEEEEGKSKLDEGFYEIEAVRRKRIRKGQLQYLIKWRGWPETANTWEPLENLQSCSDVIDAFEESLRSGKHSRKRKRRSSLTITQPKKKQQHSAIVSYNRTGAQFDEALHSPSYNNFALADPLAPPQSLNQAGEIDGNVINGNDGFANVGKNVYRTNEGSEYDPKLSELKGGLVTDQATEDKLATQFHQTKASKVDCLDPAQSNRRSGARRRKPSSVKRFKQDLASAATNIAIDSGGSIEQLQSEKGTVAGDCSGHKNSVGIVQIIQPISYSASIVNSVQDVSVLFKALRSDGKEVIVDNKFLKTADPLLLINFYEQHLKYNPVP